MATTTNYGWTTPDDTALVKDGAAAIRTLGSSVDTTTKALNPSTTLGDIEYRSSTANTNTRLGIGSTGNVLTVTGGVPVWAAPAGGGGMTLLSTTTLSGTSTTISSISQDYVNLVIFATGVQWSTGSTRIRVSVNSVLVNGRYAGVNDSTPNSYEIIVPFNDNNAASNSNSAYMIIINNYASASYKPLSYTGFNPSDVTTTTNYQGMLHDTSAVTSITHTTSAGTATLSGTIKIYGVK